MPAEIRKQNITASIEGETIVCKDSQERTVKIGGEGPRATDLLLMAIAGCSGATLAALLKRDGFKPKRLEMRVEGERSQDRPRRFSDIYVNYEILCQGLTDERLNTYLQITERACPVIQSVSSRVHLAANLKTE